MIRDAAAGGARLILTPECSNVVQAGSQSPHAGTAVVAGRRGGRARDLAGELGVEILLGSVLVRREDGLAANRSPC